MLKIKTLFPAFGLGAITTLCALAPLSAAHADGVPLVADGGDYAGAQPTGTTTAARRQFEGTVLRDVTTDYVGESFSGVESEKMLFSIRERIIRRTTSGTLDFYFQVINKPQSSCWAIDLFLGKYPLNQGFDVNYFTDGSGSIGISRVTRITRFNPGGPNVESLRFNFAPAVNAGQSSYVHYITTNARAFDTNGKAEVHYYGQRPQGDILNNPPSFPRAIAVKMSQPVYGNAVGDVTPPAAPTPEEIALRPDLRVQLTGPKTAQPGEDISSKVKLTALNAAFGVAKKTAPGTIGTLDPPNGFTIELLISKDRTSPAKSVRSSPTFKEDALLDSGRVWQTTDLERDKNKVYPVGGKIPGDTPPGNYYLIARIDPSNRVDESDEGNNLAVWPIEIKKPQYTIGDLILKTPVLEPIEKPIGKIPFGKPERKSDRDKLDLRPNLQVKMSAPSSAKAGQDISKQLKVTAFNVGRSIAVGGNGSSNTTGYIIDLVLSRDKIYPAKTATYSPKFRDDALLPGGRDSRPADLKAGASALANIYATIPKDTPAGNYFLIARIDSENKIRESDENDNLAIVPIKIN